MRIRIDCMEGIGDNLYARPFIKRLIDQRQFGDLIFIKTVLPEIFQDMSGGGVYFIRPEKAKYRTQQKMLENSVIRFVEDTGNYDRIISFYYGRKELQKNNIIGHIEQSFDFAPASTLEYNLPGYFPYHNLHLPYGKKVAIIKPVTHRKEWVCTSRSPNPNYISWCAKVLRAAGYYVISIANTDDINEWIVGDEPPADLKLHRGELNIFQTLSLIRSADLAIGGSSFIIPAAICADTPLFVIFGGRGEYDNPHKVFDLRLNMNKIGWALPTNFCRCNQQDHDCDKTIKDLDHQFMNFMARLS